MIQTDLAYFLPYSGFNNQITKNFLRQCGSCADKTVQQNNKGWNITLLISPYEIFPRTIDPRTIAPPPKTITLE